VRRSAIAAQVNAENAVRCRTPIGADISTLGATPLPSTWLMRLSGFAGFGLSRDKEAHCFRIRMIKTTNRTFEKPPRGGFFALRGYGECLLMAPIAQT
jgi:hypothetical protein